MIDGNRYRITHQKSVDAVLGPIGVYRPVHSYGNSFFNRDSWRVNFLIHKIDKDRNIAGWVEEANSQIVAERNKAIVIASTPEDLPGGTALALTGGAYHEAWHTVYSERHSLKVEEVLPMFEGFDCENPDKEYLQQWGNVIEDIRIERLGRKDYPGTLEKMEALQDFILDMEDVEQMDIRGAALCIFRDRGLEYTTVKQAETWAKYGEKFPELMELITKGPLRPILDESMALTKADRAGCLRLALKVVQTLRDESVDTTKTQQEGQDQGGRGSVVAAIIKQDGAEGEGEGQQVEVEGAESGGKSGKGSEGGNKEDSKGGNNNSGNRSAEGVDAGSRDQKSGGGEEGDEKDEGKGQAIKAILIELADSSKGAGQGIKDLSSALAESISQIVEEKKKGGQQTYLPYDASKDEEKVVVAEKGDLNKAKEALSAVRSETAYLRARFANRLRDLQYVGTLHGVRRGKTLSETYLVDSALSVRNGIMPRRGFSDVDEQMDASIAVGVLIDQSGSMYASTRFLNKRVNLSEVAMMMALTIAEPLDSLGIPTLVAGFRELDRVRSHSYSRNEDNFHRFYAVAHDIYKEFGERVKSPRVLERFGQNVASGGTPMADGLHYMRSRLREQQDKKFRFLFVLTDGQPTSPEGVMKYEFAKAKEEGIRLIGVGMGPPAEYVKETFEDHVWTDNFNEFPGLLMAKVNSLITKI